MKSNPTRAGPSLSGNPHSKPSSEGLRSQGRLATDGVEGAR